MKAVWITPSQARAPAARLSVFGSSTLCASTPKTAPSVGGAAARRPPMSALGHPWSSDRRRQAGAYH